MYNWFAERALKHTVTNIHTAAKEKIARLMMP